MKGKQIVFERKSEAVLQDFVVPRPGAEEIVIENAYTVISAGLPARAACQYGRRSGRESFCPGT